MIDGNIRLDIRECQVMGQSFRSSHASTLLFVAMFGGASASCAPRSSRPQDPKPTAHPSPPSAVERGRGLGDKTSTAEERERALRIVRAAEQHPLADDPATASDRQWLLVWMSASRDITVLVCSDLLGSIEQEQSFKYGDYLLVQTMWGQLRFTLEHPDTKPGDEAVFSAGLASALVAYRNILSIQPESHWPLFDELLTHQGDGALKPYVEQAMRQCLSSDPQAK